MVVPLLQIDAFTDTPFSGNPAAVSLLDIRSDDTAWMQRVAAEMNLSETAFVAPRPDGDLDLRWFTPTVEVELCGHATLASAHALWETARLRSDEGALFHTRSGLLSATRSGELVELDFPARSVRPIELPPDALDALRAPGARAAFDSGHQIVVDVPDEAAVLATVPDFRTLAAVADRGWVVTAPAPRGSSYDFVSRYFAPRYGIDEDPVTGSAHCVLGPLWAERLAKTDLVGHQVSARGGVVRVRVLGERVALGGRAVTVLRGELVA